MINLNDDEMQMLETFIQSPAYGIMKKLVRADREATTGQLLSEKDPMAIYRLQGRVTGLSYIENIAEVLVSLRISKKKKDDEILRLKNLNDPHNLPHNKLK